MSVHRCLSGSRTLTLATKKGSSKWMSTTAGIESGGRFDPTQWIPCRILETPERGCLWILSSATYDDAISWPAKKTTAERFGAGTPADSRHTRPSCNNTKEKKKGIETSSYDVSCDHPGTRTQNLYHRKVTRYQLRQTAIVVLLFCRKPPYDHGPLQAQDASLATPQRLMDSEMGRDGSCSFPLPH